MKLTIKKNPTGAKVYDENGELVASIKNKPVASKRLIENFRDKEQFSTLVKNGEDCIVLDEDGLTVVSGKIHFAPGRTIASCGPVSTLIEFGEDAYIVKRTKGDNLIVEKQERDEDYKEYVIVSDAAGITTSVESNERMSVTTMLVIYIFAKYMYDARLTTLV